MTKRQVWRWSCGFCKQRKFSEKAMVRHEAGCTANPNRVCGMPVHELTEQMTTQKMVEILFSCPDEDRALAMLREEINECPACTLAAIRAACAERPYCIDEDGRAIPGYMVEYDFKKDMNAFWDGHNEQTRKY